MKKIEKNGIAVTLDEHKLSVSMKKGDTVWRWREEFQPRLICEEGEFLFQDAVNIFHENYSMGIGEGIRSRFEGFVRDGREFPYSFETLIWEETATGNIFFEWIPLCEEGLHVKTVFWPVVPQTPSPRARKPSSHEAPLHTAGSIQRKYSL